MKFTVTYYGHEKTTRTASGAIRAAKELVKTYGAGNRAPVINVETDAEAEEMVSMMAVAQVSYCVRLNGAPVA